MKQYQSFIFDSYLWNEERSTIELRYTLDDEIKFVETLTLPRGSGMAVNEEEFHRALFTLHLIGGISYYKTCLPKQIVIRSGSLTKEQAEFWQSVYENGLGEFFYKNDIDYRGLIQFPSATTNEQPAFAPAGATADQRETSNEQHVLVPIGGGKDSLVTAELLKHSSHKPTLFRMGHHALIDTLADAADLPLITVKRALSPALFKLNEDGALNGHVPISAYLSCVAVVVALMQGFDAVAMSNERSASEGNIEFHGKEINHQWSKSLAFERAFRRYLTDFVTDKVSYFSLLRPLSELQIAKLMAGSPQYFHFFTSCNENWKILHDSPKERWCSQCPKCAFAFALMAAFLPKKTLEDIFGSILFDAPALLPFYSQLLGLEGCKPFECVGTVDETSAAFLLAHERKELKNTGAMKLFLEKVLPGIQDPKKLIKDTMTPSNDHAVPPAFSSVLPRS